MGSGGGGDEQGDGKTSHARGADLGQVGEQVQAVHPAGRRDRQRGTGKKAPLPDCVPKLPLRHRPAGRMAPSATLLVGSTRGTSREVQRVGHTRTTEAGTSSPNAAPPGFRDPGSVPAAA